MKQIDGHWQVLSDKLIFNFENYSGHIIPSTEHISFDNETEVVWVLRLDYPSDKCRHCFPTLEDAICHVLEEAKA